MELVLYIVAVVLFAVAAFGVSAKINLVALGLAFFAAAEMFSHAVAITG